MRTTIDLEDKLFRRAKAEAALRGVSLRKLIEGGVRLALEAKPEKAVKRKRVKLPLFGAKKLGKLPISEQSLFQALQDQDSHHANPRRS